MKLSKGNMLLLVTPDVSLGKALNNTDLVEQWTPKKAKDFIPSKFGHIWILGGPEGLADGNVSRIISLGRQRGLKDKVRKYTSLSDLLKALRELLKEAKDDKTAEQEDLPDLTLLVRDLFDLEEWETQPGETTETILRLVQEQYPEGQAPSPGAIRTAVRQEAQASQNVTAPANKPKPVRTAPATATPVPDIPVETNLKLVPKENHGNVSTTDVIPAEKISVRRPSLVTPSLVSSKPSAAFKELIDEGEVIKVPVFDIEANPGQPRQEFDPVDMQELRDSLGSTGQKIPGLITPKEGCPGKYILVDGERRWRCCGDLGIATYKAIVVYGDPGELYLLSVIANCARAGHNDVELAFSIAKTKQIRPDDSNAKIARYYGKSKSWVEHHLDLLTLPEEVLRLMLPPHPPKKRLTYSNGLLLVGLPQKDQIELAHEFHSKSIKFGKAKWLVEQRKGLLRSEGKIRARPVHQYEKLCVLLANFEEKSELLLQMTNPTLIEVFNTRGLEDCEEVINLLGSCSKSITKLQQLMKRVILSKPAAVA